jgi:hypothetical protein
LVVFLILFFIVNILLKKLDSLNKEESEKKWIQYLSKIMNKFPKWIFVVIEIYIALSFLKFSDKISLILKAIFLLVITIFAIKIAIKCIDFSLEKFFRKDKTAKKSVETIITVVVRAL